MVRAEESSKSLPVQAGDAPAVAFLGPKRWWPLVFYFPLMMAAAAGADTLTTDSSISASFSIYRPVLATLMMVGTSSGPVHGSHDARSTVLTYVPAWSNSHLSVSWLGAPSC